MWEGASTLASRSRPCPKRLRLSRPESHHMKEELTALQSARHIDIRVLGDDLHTLEKGTLSGVLLPSLASRAKEVAERGKGREESVC